MSIDVDRLAAEMVRGAQLLIEKATAPLIAENAVLRADLAAIALRVAAQEERAMTPGPQGEPGRDGIDGKDGEPGNDGVDGEQGERGTDGTNGRDGTDGIDGKDGEPGPQGERGSEGAVGKMPITQEYADRVHYAGEIVTHNGATWQAKTDTGKTPGGDEWACLARAGSDGRTPDVRGTYSPDDVYHYLDVVACNGGSFVALRDGPGECPGPGWQLLTSPGKRGQKGEDGPKGDRGQEGKAAASLIAVAVNNEGVQTFAFDDGNTLEADFYPVLRQLK